MNLARKLVRDIKQSAGQFTAFVVVIAVGAFFYTGLTTLSDNLNAYTKEYFKEHNLSDLQVHYSQITQQDADELSSIAGIDKIETRHTFNASQAYADYQASLKIHSIPEHNEINTPAIIKGSIPLQKGEILVDSHYAKAHQYDVGDPFTFLVNDNKFTFTISGLGENVEYTKKNETQDHHTHGVAYIAEESIQEVSEGFYYNELLVDASEGRDIDAIGQSIQAQSGHLPYLSQVSKERTFSYSQIRATIYNNKMMSIVIPILFFTIEAIILFLTMSRLIDSQRKQVGVMKALGIKNRSIMLHYMGYPVLVGVMGSILGFVIASAVFIPFITNSNGRSYSLPDIAFSPSILAVFPPILISSAFGILSCYISCRALLQESAAQAMRPKPPRKTKQLLLEKIPGLWNIIPYSWKLIVRNIFLNKQKALLSSIGVVVSTVLLITAFSTQAALQKIAGQVEQAYTYDLRVDYSNGIHSSSLRLPSGIASNHLLSALPAALIRDDEEVNANLIVTEKENSLIHFFDEEDNKLPLENNGVLVPQSYADKYHIVEGDRIRLLFTEPELKNKTVEMKVSHISAMYSNPAFYCTPSYLRSFGIEYNPTSILIEADSTADLPSIRSFFEADQRVDAITDKVDLKKTSQYILRQNSFMFIMFIICAAILSLGAIYTISSINIYERNRELATLRVLGYQKSRIMGLIFTENIILTTVAVLIALPVSGYLFEIIVRALSSTHQQIPDQLNTSVLLVSVILAYLLTVVSTLLLRRKAARINMIESLKSFE